VYWENEIISPIVNENGEITNFIAIKEDITPRKVFENQMKASILEKEVLLKEIHHRVKNNMQIVTSLLALQIDELDNPDTIKEFIKAESRVHSMSLAHELLYSSDNLSGINFQEYLEKLTEHISSKFTQTAGIEIKLQARNIKLQLDDAIPAGLVLNELVSNIYKHAFPDGGGGKIKITILQLPDNQYEMTIADNGIGFPEGFDWKTSKSLGLRLVKGLVLTQMRGSMNLINHRGVCWAINWQQKIK
jgi:two-component sensor histidine kinase